MPPSNYCAVIGCKSQKSNRSLSFFSLPVNEARRKRWLEAIERPDLKNPNINPKCYFVCSIHFEKYMITSRLILKSDAEPVRFLPNQPGIYNDSEEYKDVSTQTECYMNGLSVLGHVNTFPEVPIVKQENVEDETIYQTINIKQEYIENVMEPESSNQEDKQAKNSHRPVKTKKIRGKTKQPRKSRKIKSRKEFEVSEIEKRLS